MLIPRIYDYHFLGHPSHYETMSMEFADCHKDPTNILLHFITTPIGIIGALSLLRNYTKTSSFGAAMFSLYLISLIPILPAGTFYGTVILCGLMFLLNRYLNLNNLTSFVFLLMGYLLQDFAHYLTGEKTFQASYSDGGQVC